MPSTRLVSVAAAMEPDDLSICDIARSLGFESRTPKRKVRSRDAKVGPRPDARHFKAELKSPGIRAAFVKFDFTRTWLSALHSSRSFTGMVDGAHRVGMKEDVAGLGHYGKTLTVLFTGETIESDDADEPEDTYERWQRRSR
jgi:hypothetical protein